MSTYDSYGNRQQNTKISCKCFLNSKYFLGASSIFHKIKNNLSNLVFLGKEDGIDYKSKHLIKNSSHNLDGSQSNEFNQVYDAPTLELNMTNELDNPIHLNTNINMDYVNKNMNDTRVRKFSLDSSRINHIKKKSNPITRIVHYITEKKFETKEKNDFSMSMRNSSFTSKESAFKPIDNRSKNINLHSKKMINYNDFLEALKDKNIVKPVAVRRSSSAFTQLAQKRSRPLENSFVLQEEEKNYANGHKMRKVITDDDRSLFSSVQNLNKIRNTQRDDVSMKSLNSVMSYKFIKEDKGKNNIEKNINYDDVSMNFIIPENKSIVRSYYSKTLEEIKSEIEQKRGKGLRMLDEISKKSRKSKEEMKMDYDDKKKFLSKYYKEKDKNQKELDLLNKDGRISLEDSDLNKDRNLSYSKSSMMIESAPKKNKNVNIVKSSNFDICSNKEEKLVEVKETIKEKPKINENTNNNMFFVLDKPNTNNNMFFVLDKQNTLGNSNALTDKKISFNEKKLEIEKNYSQPDEKISPLFPVSQIIGTNIKESDENKTFFGFGDKKSNLEEKNLIEITPAISEIKAGEKAQDSMGLFSFGQPAAKNGNSGLFGNIEKKEGTTDSALFFGNKKEEKVSLYDNLNKKDEATAPFSYLLDKKEAKGEQEKKDVKTIFSNFPEKNEEKPALNLVQVEKNEGKQIFFDNKFEEPKPNTVTQPSLFSFQQSVKKTEPDQKSTSLFSSSSLPKNNNDNKTNTNETLVNSEEKSPIFGNKDIKSASNFSFPIQTNVLSNNNVFNTSTSNQSLFAIPKEDKEEKPTPKSANIMPFSNISSSSFNNKPAESTIAPKLFVKIQGQTETSFLNEPTKHPTIDSSSLLLLQKDQPPSTSLVNETNPFLMALCGDKKAPTIFQSPNKPGINIFNFLKADGMNNPMSTTSFSSGLGRNNILSSSINNSNRSNDIFENADKGPTNKGFVSSGQNLASNPFMPKPINHHKNDIFNTNADTNDTMAISPIQSPKMMPKNDDMKNPNLFQPMGMFGGNSMGFGGIGQFNATAGNNMLLNPMSNITTNNNPFSVATNTHLFPIQPSTQNVPQGNNSGTGLFGLFNMNQPSTGMFPSNPTATGSNLSFSIGKKK